MEKNEEPTMEEKIKKKKIEENLITRIVVMYLIKIGQLLVRKSGWHSMLLVNYCKNWHPILNEMK